MFITDNDFVTGKATGVVSNAAITHATPASAYASTVGRVFEADNVVPPMWTEYCPDIAKQLIERGHKINVYHFSDVPVF